MTLSVMHLTKENMGSEVLAYVGIAVESAEAPGITVLAVTNSEGSWCLVADSPQNRGVSATNGFEAYAAKACELLDSQPGRYRWFELDSTGAFDEVLLEGGTAHFRTVTAPETVPRSYAAFAAEVGAVPKAAKDLIKGLEDRLLEKSA